MYVLCNVVEQILYRSNATSQHQRVVIMQNKHLIRREFQMFALRTGSEVCYTSLTSAFLHLPLYILLNCDVL